MGQTRTFMTHEFIRFKGAVYRLSFNQDEFREVPKKFILENGGGTIDQMQDLPVHVALVYCPASNNRAMLWCSTKNQEEAIQKARQRMTWWWSQVNVEICNGKEVGVLTWTMTPQEFLDITMYWDPKVRDPLYNSIRWLRPRKPAPPPAVFTDEFLTGPDPIMLNQIPEGWRVIMPYGHYDFSPGANFFFVIIPEKTRGSATWTKIWSAVKRFASDQLGKPFSQRERGSRSIDTLISSADGLENADAQRMLTKQSEKQRLWTIFDPNQQKLRLVKYQLK
jgi:hypothetical protein